ncbi:MAG: hypothetical protein WAU00_16855, partial [Caldilinea sp.]
MLAEQRFSSGVITNGVAPIEVAGVAALGAPLSASGQSASPTEPQERRRQSQKQLARLDEVAWMLNGLTTADAAFQSAMAGAGLME